MTINACASWLAKYDQYLIISHKRPDGDTLCSGAAMCSALRRTGKTAYCFDNPETTENYQEFVEPYLAPSGYAHDFAITVDIADKSLFPEGIDYPIDLAIDHHPSNDRCAGALCLDAGKSSCGELVFEIIKVLCGSVSAEEADLLYIAVSTDTGCFQYMNTNAMTFRAAAELLDLGADNRRMNTLFFRSVTRARLALEGMIFAGLRFYKHDLIVASIVTLEMMALAGTTENDCEDLAGIPGKTAGVLLSIMIRQLEIDSCKISLRSRSMINCTEICAVFGGGGHAMAAGCTIDQEPEKALAMILEAVDERWPEI